jgi:hypothetical protein
MAQHRLKQWNCNTIQGYSLFHSVASISMGDPTKLMSQELSFYCEPYQNMDFDECDNSEDMDNWISIKIHLHTICNVVAQMPQYGEGNDSIS